MSMDFKKPITVLRELEKDNAKGIYFIKLINKDAFALFNPDFHKEYVDRGRPEIIYVGKGTGQGKLYTRLCQELRQEWKATFFRSIGALIGAIPKNGQADFDNYKFVDEEEKKVIDFIDSNIEVYYRKMYIPDKEIEAREKELIIEMQPIINIKDNPYKSASLQKARAFCRQTAGEGVTITNTSKTRKRKGMIID